MAKGDWKIGLQKIIAHSGYQLRRMERGVSLDDPYATQRTMLGDRARVIVEIGAADGRDAEAYCEAFPYAHVYAFEPMPGNFAKLKARADRIDRLHAVECALAEMAGRAQFNIAEWADASSLLAARTTGSTFDDYHKAKAVCEVEVDTLDRFCASNGVSHIDLVKMDAQGAELSILHGSANLLSAGAIDMIFTEVQFLPLYEGAPRYDELALVLYRYGFRLHNFYGLQHNHRGELCWGDALFIHERISGRTA